MTDLNPYVPVPMQQRIGPLMISDKAVEHLTKIVTAHGHPEMTRPEAYGPVAVASAGRFLDSAYFKSAWFKRQPVHTTTLFCIRPLDDSEPTTPLFHMTRNPQGGYTIVACEEAPLPETYYEERVVEEVRVELGLSK